MSQIKYELIDHNSTATQKVENQMDEKYYNLERQLRSLAEKSQGSVNAEKLQFGIESQIDDLKSQVNKL